MARVSTEIKNGKLLVVSEYNAEWVKRAKTLGGKWQSSEKAWAFDRDDAADVSAVLLDIYGEDGSGDVETCDITVRVDLLDNDQEITLCGIPVCTAAEAAEKVGRETQLTKERDKLVAEIKKLQARVDAIDDELRSMVLIL